MGIFDMFLSEEKRIQKEQRTLTSRDKQPEDRENAARWLASNGSPKAYVALLTRFDMKLTNTLHDQAEKEFVFSLLINAGQVLERPLDRHLRRCKSLAMPLRLFLELNGEDATVQKVFELLRHELEHGSDFKPEKKIDLLVWLADKRHADAIEVCAPFLEDFDESVRCAAAEVLIYQASDTAQPPLEKAISKVDEESNRLRVRLAEVFSQRRWPLAHPEAVAAALMPSFAVSDQGLVVSA